MNEKVRGELDTACREAAVDILEKRLDLLIADLERRLPYKMLLDEEGYLVFRFGCPSIYDSHGGDSELNCRSGEKCWVLYPLFPKNYDRFDVGMMYRIRFGDGFETDAFEDELLPAIAADQTENK